MKLCSLASGSAGNATLVYSDSTRILVDDGLSVRELVRRMAEIGESPDRLTAVIVTHAHIDHVSGLARLAKHALKRGFVIPIYLTEGTCSKIAWNGLESPPVTFFKPGASFVIGDIEVGSFTTPHDCLDPVAFTLRSNHAKVGIAVDLGFVPDAVRARFRDLDALVIESNHDAEMLRNGPYLDAIKRRVGGQYGHLSNNATQEYFRSDLGAGVRHVVIAHLSRDNNQEILAREGAEEALRRCGSQAAVTVARQDERTEVIQL